MKIEIEKQNGFDDKPRRVNLILAAENREEVRFLQDLSTDLRPYLYLNWNSAGEYDILTETLTLPIHGIHEDAY